MKAGVRREERNAHASPDRPTPITHTNTGKHGRGKLMFINVRQFHKFEFFVNVSCFKIILHSHALVRQMMIIVGNTNHSHL